MRGNLDARGDLDWFGIRAVQGQTWILRSPRGRLECVEIHGIFEGDLLLEDCEGDHTVWTIPESGDYAVRISPRTDYRSRATIFTEYEFTLSIAEPDDHGNSSGDASVLIAGEPQSGQIDYIGDRDVFRLNVAAGEFWRIGTAMSYYSTSYETRFVPSGSGSGTAATWQPLHGGYVLVSPAAGHWLISVGGGPVSGDYTISAGRLEPSLAWSDYYRNNRATGVLHPVALPNPLCEDSADDTPTLHEWATQLEPNVVHEVGPDGDGGDDLYRVRLDHPRYVIEVTGGPTARGVAVSEQFGLSYVDEIDRWITPVPPDPPVEYDFRVAGGASRPYTVVVREYVSSDEYLGWRSITISPPWPFDCAWDSVEPS